MGGGTRGRSVVPAPPATICASVERLVARTSDSAPSLFTVEAQLLLAEAVAILEQKNRLASELEAHGPGRGGHWCSRGRATKRDRAPAVRLRRRRDRSRGRPGRSRNGPRSDRHDSACHCGSGGSRAGISVSRSALVRPRLKPRIAAPRLAPSAGSLAGPKNKSASASTTRISPKPSLIAAPVEAHGGP